MEQASVAENIICI